MAASRLREALRPEHERTLRRVLAGAAMAAVIYAIVGGLASGFCAWLWASTADNSETNSEAVGWLFIFSGFGTIVFAPIGAIVGLAARVWGRWPRRSWILPLVGGLLAGLASSSGWDSANNQATLALWPIVGVTAGVMIHILFSAIVAPRYH